MIHHGVRTIFASLLPLALTQLYKYILIWRMHTLCTRVVDVRHRGECVCGISGVECCSTEKSKEREEKGEKLS